MSQQVDMDESRSYQTSSRYPGALYQGQQAYPVGSGRPSAQVFVQPTNTGESATSRHRLTLAICSVVALAVAVIAFVSALETFRDGSGYNPLFALIGLGLICATIATINVAFNRRR
jgi:hypothetical protein